EPLTPLRKICPHCGKDIKAKADVCKYCHADVSPEAMVAAAAAARPDTEPHPDTKTCRYCAEEIKWDATVCKHCGRDLQVSRSFTPPSRQNGKATGVSEFALMENMTQEQRMLFQAQYGRAVKNRTTAFLLTFFLGGVGAHRFYLGQVGLGILYAV